jgi:hypothetical protein
LRDVYFLWKEAGVSMLLQVKVKKDPPIARLLFAKRIGKFIWFEEKWNKKVVNWMSILDNEYRAYND